MAMPPGNGSHPAILLPLLLFLLCVSPAHSAGVTNLSHIPFALKGEVIRIGWVPTPGAVNIASDGKVTGWLYDLIKKMETDGGGMTFKTTVVRNESLLKTNGSLLDACIEDIQADILDTCGGIFWETSNHRGRVSFTTTMFSESFQLQVGTVSESAAALISHVFFPFEDGLWFVLLALVIFMSLAVYVAEYLYVHRPDQASDFSDLQNPVASGSKTVYLGFIGLVSGGPIHAPQSIGGRIIICGFGFFVLVVTASYTANLAAFLTVSGLQTTFNSLSEAMAVNAKICAHKDIISQLRHKYPKANFALESNTMFKEADIANGVVNKVCDCSINNVEEFAAVQTGTLCSLSFVGSSLLHMPVALPVHPEMEPTLSYYLAGYRSDGTLQKELDKWRPTPQCGSTGSSSQRLRLEQMTGTFSVCGASLVAGAIAAVIQRVVQSQQANKVVSSDLPTKEGNADEVLASKVADIAVQLAQVQELLAKRQASAGSM